MKISEDFLSCWCPSTWLAKAFSEYTLKAAEKATSVLETVNDLASNDDIETFVNETVEEWDDTLQELANECQKELAVSGNFSGFNLDESASKEAVLAVLESKPNLKASLQTKGTALYGEGFDIESELTNDPTGIFKKDSYQALFNSEEITSIVDDKVQEMSDQLAVEPDAQLPIGDGYAEMQDLVKAAVCSFEAPSADCKIHVPGYDIEGNQLSSTIDVSYEDISSALKDTIASATIIGQASAVCASETAEEAIQNFENSVEQVIDTASTKFTGQIAYVKDVLVQTTGRADAFLATMYDKVGGVLFDNDEFTIPANTDIAEYTGASPLLALGLQGLAKGASILGKTIIGAGLMIWKIVKTVVPAAFSKIGQAVWWLINPCDVEVVRELNLQPVMDVLSIQSTANILLKPGQYDTDWTSMKDFLCGTFKTDNLNKWISIDTFTMQVMFKFNSIGSEVNNYVRVNFDYVLKPKILKHQSLVDRNLSVLQPGATRYAIPAAQLLNPEDWANNFKFGTDGYYMTVNTTTENDAFMGFSASRASFFMMGAIGLYKLATQFNQKYDGVWSLAGHGCAIPEVDDIILPYHEFDVYNPGVQSFYTCDTYSQYRDRLNDVLTNTDWFNSATGYYYNSYFQRADYCYAEKWDLIPGIGMGWTDGSYADGIVSYIFMFILQQYDKYADPENYVFIPFCRNSYAIGKGRFGVLTDANIANRVDTFCSVVVTVVLIATLALLTKKVLRAIKIHKIAKWNATQGVLDNAMWNGAKLNRKEAKRYYKAKRKLAKIEGGCSGLAGSTPIVETVSKLVPSSNDQPSAADIDTETRDSILLTEIKRRISG